MAQRSYDPLDFLDAGVAKTLPEATQMALKRRNEALRHFRKSYPCEDFSGFALRGQLRPYKSFGVPDGSVRTVYYIQSNGFTLPHGRAPITEGCY